MKSWAVYFRFSFRKALTLVLLAAAASPALAVFGLSWETGQLAVAGLTLVVGAVFLCFAWAAAGAIVARRFHFSLRTLLILTTLLAVLLATAGRWMLKLRRDVAERSTAIATLTEMGAVLYFECDFGGAPGWTELANGMIVPNWIRSPFVDSYISRLRQINLNGRPLSQRDIQRLSTALENVPVIQAGLDIQLDGTGIGDRDLALIAKVRNVRSLQLRNNQLTDACLEDLAQMQRLEWVLLTGNPVSVSAVGEMLKNKPTLDMPDPWVLRWLETNR